MPLCPDCRGEAETWSRDAKRSWLTRLLCRPLSVKTPGSWQGDCDECSRCTVR